MDNVNMNDILNSRIKLRMSELGTNATNAAIDSGLGKTAVRDILSGKTKSPTVETLGRLASTLQCTVSYLLGDVEHSQAFRPSDEEIADVQFIDIPGIVRAGTFRKPSKKRESFGQNVMYGHPIAPEHSISLLRVGDDSMSDIGILPGDVVTIAMPYNEADFELTRHDLIAVARTVIPPGLEEISLREVHFKDGRITLKTRPKDEAPDIIDIEQEVSGPGVYNLYSTTDGHGLTILGFVIRVTRDIPEF